MLDTTGLIILLSNKSVTSKTFLFSLAFTCSLHLKQKAKKTNNEEHLNLANKRAGFVLKSKRSCNSQTVNVVNLTSGGSKNLWKLASLQMQNLELIMFCGIINFKESFKKFVMNIAQKLTSQALTYCSCSGCAVTNCHIPKKIPIPLAPE